MYHTAYLTFRSFLELRSGYRPSGKSEWSRWVPRTIIIILLHQHRITSFKYIMRGQHHRGYGWKYLHHCRWENLFLWWDFHYRVYKLHVPSVIRILPKISILIYGIPFFLNQRHQFYMICLSRLSTNSYLTIFQPIKLWGLGFEFLWSPHCGWTCLSGRILHT